MADEETEKRPTIISPLSTSFFNKNVHYICGVHKFMNKYNNKNIIKIIKL
jgi:hypothetical protein